MIDGEDSEQQEPCVVCREHHDQMLMLSCVHDPCINCAAKHYVETEPEDSNVPPTTFRLTHALPADRRLSSITPVSSNFARSTITINESVGWRQLEIIFPSVNSPKVRLSQRSKIRGITKKLKR